MVLGLGRRRLLVVTAAAAVVLAAGGPPEALASEPTSGWEPPREDADPNSIDYDVHSYAERASAFIYNLGDIPEKWRPYLSTNICDLNGTWELMLSKSDPLDSILQAMGISWFKRKALRSHVSTTHIHVVSPQCAVSANEDLSWVPPPRLVSVPGGGPPGRAQSSSAGGGDEPWVLENPFAFPDDFPDAPAWLEEGDELAEDWLEGMGSAMDGVHNPQHYVKFTTLFPFRTKKTGILSVNSSVPFDYHDQDTGVWSTLADYVDGRLLQRRVSKQWGVMFDVRAVILPGAFTTHVVAQQSGEDDLEEDLDEEDEDADEDAAESFDEDAAESFDFVPADFAPLAGEDTFAPLTPAGTTSGRAADAEILNGAAADGDGESPAASAAALPPLTAPVIVHSRPVDIAVFNNNERDFDDAVLNAIKDIELTEDVVLTDTPLMLFRWSLATPDGKIIITDRWNKKVLPKK